MNEKNSTTCFYSLIAFLIILFIKKSEKENHLAAPVQPVYPHHVCIFLYLIFLTGSLDGTSKCVYS